MSFFSNQFLRFVGAWSWRCSEFAFFLFIGEEFILSSESEFGHIVYGEVVLAFVLPRAGSKVVSFGNRAHSSFGANTAASCAIESVARSVLARPRQGFVKEIRALSGVCFSAHRLGDLHFGVSVVVPAWTRAHR